MCGALTCKHIFMDAEPRVALVVAAVDGCGGRRVRRGGGAEGARRGASGACGRGWWRRLGISNQRCHL